MANSIVGTKRNIQILRGLSSDRSLLSCTGNGQTVDLYNIDDGSGRQEWNISLVPTYDDLYHIMVYGGTSGDNVYLSCNEVGGGVNLYFEDDGSGRQRWQVIPLTSNIPAYYNIKVSGGTGPEWVFLSCTGDGVTVDLYYEDDGSGRQRWQLQ